MEDSEIVRLYWARSESAIEETANKYGGYCMKIAVNILDDEEDAKECVTDAYFQVWESVPPNTPSFLSVYLGKITRNLALNRMKYLNRQKRGGKTAKLIFEEIEDCIPDGQDTEKQFDDRYIAELINAYLKKLPEEDCSLFLRRYWYFDSIKEIALRYSVSESRVKSRLHRMRKKLKAALEEGGVVL